MLNITDHSGVDGALVISPYKGKRDVLVTVKLGNEAVNNDQLVSLQRTELCNIDNQVPNAHISKTISLRMETVCYSEHLHI